MGVRVGRINRHEDVHGVSGTGDDKAEVVEFSDGSIAVRWLGKDASTNVTNNIKNVVNVHGHGGKTEVEWIWEEEAPPDPMEAVFEKKILEAGGSTAATGATGATSPVREAAESESESESLADEIVEKVAEMLAEKVAQNSKASEKKVTKKKKPPTKKATRKAKDAAKQK
jgi:hypothetical protein